MRLQGGGFNIVDDRHGFRPAGTERWLKSGFLDAERVLPLSILERQACYYVFSEPAAICQNMFLATEALGLGGWKHCGFLSLEIFERMGFRIAGDGAVRQSGRTRRRRHSQLSALVSDHGCGGRRGVFAELARGRGDGAASHVERAASRRRHPPQRRRARLHQGGLQLHLRDLWPLSRHVPMRCI